MRRIEPEISSHTQPSYPAQAGYPVRRGLSALSPASLEYWIVRPSAQLRTRRTMTANTPSPSRGAYRPGFANRFAQTGGRRECRVLAAPAVPCARDGGRGAHEHTGTAGALRHPLRNGFTAYAELSPETNSSCLRHRRIDGVRKPGRVCYASADLTPATGARTTRPYFRTRMNTAELQTLYESGAYRLTCSLAWRRASSKTRPGLKPLSLCNGRKRQGLGLQS